MLRRDERSNEGAEDMSIKVECDDDHFASSFITLKTSKIPIGMILEVHAQFGKENYAFLRSNELDDFILALEKIRDQIRKEEKHESLCRS
jgi:hypothetical protein